MLSGSVTQPKVDLTLVLPALIRADPRVAKTLIAEPSIGHNSEIVKSNF
jgi:hypothetical protein